MVGDQFTDCIVQDVASSARNALVGGPFGSDLVSKDYVPSGVPVIRGTNMGHGRWVAGEFAYVTSAKADSLSANCAKPGDVVFTQRGTLGQVALIPAKGAERYLISQSQMKLTVDDAKADTLFLYYVFTSGDQQEYIRQNAIQTGVPHTNLGILRTTPLLLPPLATLDDKIELNRRMNGTLEAMARALFQSWFVDFDPVLAKLDGRIPTGLDHATAVLFPEHFDHKAEGVVPTGWNLKRWGDIATLEYGKSIRDYQESTGKYRVFGTNGPIGFHDKALYNNAGIVIGRKGAYRGVHYSPEPFFVIDTAFYLKPKASLDLKWAYYELLRFDINSMDSGSAIPSTSRDDFYGIPVIVPPTEIQTAFGKIVGGWFAKIFANDEESRTLAALRDTLLPKLLSGEFSVKEPEADAL